MCLQRRRRYKDAYVYSLDDRQKIEREIMALEKLGFHTEFTDRLPLPFSVAGAVRYPNQAQFHPLKFISALSQGLHIYEHTAVRELVGTTAITTRGKITAKKIIVATQDCMTLDSVPYIGAYSARTADLNDANLARTAVSPETAVLFCHFAPFVQSSPRFSPYPGQNPSCKPPRDSV